MAARPHRCLSACILGTKLMIFAHANADEIGIVVVQNPTNAALAMGAATFGQRVYLNMGPRFAGLIAFKACLIGRRRFLPELAAELAKRGPGRLAHRVQGDYTDI